jgi:PKD domain
MSFVPLVSRRRSMVGALGALLAAIALTVPASVVALAPASFPAAEGSQFSGTLATAGCSTSGTPAVTWGDGTTSPGSFGQSGQNGTPVNGQHTYGEAGTYHGSVTYSDDCNSNNVVPFDMQVSDPALSAPASSITATAGRAFGGVVAHFTDADPQTAASDYTTSVSWGDGSVSMGSVAAAAGGGFDVSADHTYAAAGSYAVDVTITDVPGAINTISHGTANVATAPTSSFTVATANPASGQVLAFDGSTSRAPAGGIAQFAWDFDGSGRFDATCPASHPIAYKLFDSPGLHSVDLHVLDTAGQVSSSHATLTLALRGGSRRARTANNVALDPALNNVKNFWCGDSSSLLGASLGYLPLTFTSDVHAVGMDVTQGVVPTPPPPPGISVIARSLAPAFKFRDVSPFAGKLSQYITLWNFEENPRENRISWLQKGGKTVVRVYASAQLAPFGDSVSNVQMKLYGVRDGHDLPGSPLLSESGPQDVPVGPPFTTHAMRIGYDALKGALPAFTFTLPDSWTQGDLAMLARPVLVGARLDRQCSSVVCSLAQQVGSGDFQFNNTGLFIIRSVAMSGSKDPPMPSPSSVFDQAINLSPVAVLPSPYQATINIDSILNCVPSPAYNCKNPNGTANGLINAWNNANQPFIPSLIKILTIGVGSGHSQINGYSGWPGACADNANGGAICETSTNSPVSEVDAGRPLTSVGHEMFHDLGRPHADNASSGCGGNGEGKPDYRGHLQGIGLDRHPGSGGSATNPYRLLSPDLPGQPTQQYDLMSYCASNYPDNDSWLSPHNWDTVASDWLFFEKRATGSPRALPRLATSAAAADSVNVSGYTDATGTHVTRIEPASTAAGIAAAPSDSPYHAVTHDVSGATIGDVPLIVLYGHLDPAHRGDPSTPVTAFHGTVPAAGAERLDISQSGVVVTTQTRSAVAPTVRLLSPRRGRIGRGRSVRVAWMTRGNGPLMALVDYSVDGGGHWRNVFTGPNTNGTSLPSRYFTGSSDARIRVRINDGFNEATVSSGRLQAVGSAPAVTITSPAGGQRVQSDASVYLRGYAFDDAFNVVPTQRLGWFLGRRRLGTGASVSAVDLPPGRDRLRLVASDGHRRSASASVTVTVVAARPFFVTLQVPVRISRGARAVRLMVATNGPATLIAGGRRFAVGRRPRTISVPLRGKGGAIATMALKLVSHRLMSTQTLVLARG